MKNVRRAAIKAPPTRHPTAAPAMGPVVEGQFLPDDVGGEMGEVTVIVSRAVVVDGAAADGVVGFGVPAGETVNSMLLISISV